MTNSKLKEKILLKKYEDGSTVSLLTLNDDYMDKYIIDNFNDENDLKEYFKGNDLLDNSTFKLLSVDKNGYIEEEKILFKSDFESLSNDVINVLLNDDNYLRFLLDNEPDIFQGSLYERLDVSLSGLTLSKIHQRNVDTFKNFLINDGLLYNVRTIYNLTLDYKKASSNKVLVKNIEEQ